MAKKIKSGKSSACKKCLDIGRLKWRQKNRERIREYSKIYRERHKHEANERTRKWRTKNKDKVKTYRYNYYNVPKQKFKLYQCNAKKRNLVFKIAFSHFCLIMSCPCVYCGTKGVMGIDRKNNKIGYVKNNCAPCCKTCNLMKRMMSVDEFICHCKKISKFNK